jgi:hypothetical protein
MADIIKTWPASCNARAVVEVFRQRKNTFATYYFTLGRGMPQKPIDRLWFTWRGRILGSFVVDHIAVNDGSFPRLRRLDGEESAWQIKPDARVAICIEDCQPLKERLYMGGFRGWRYFDIDAYRETPASRFPL